MLSKVAPVCSMRSNMLHYVPYNFAMLRES
uniref:Uncharacterized protein n=1 Tax=Arundo donax TaxID=35708 RepID=A0A0A8YRK9_ARUDO